MIQQVKRLLSNLRNKKLIGVNIMKTLGLVSCTKRKQEYPCKASEMYQPSDLFKKAYSYCKKTYDRVAILSAKYGLLYTDDEIEPYDLTLNTMNTQKIFDWSNKVFSQMQDRFDLNEIETVFFHAGNNYRKYLIPKLETLGIEVKIPLVKLSLGKQLGWYKKKLE